MTNKTKDPRIISDEFVGKIPCPNCGQDTEQDYNSYWCDDCEKLWPKVEEPEPEMLDAIGVWIVGHDAYPVAIFRYEEHAEEWGRDNYFGQWLTREIEIPAIPFATEEEWAEARKEGAKLALKFKQLPEAEADDD